MAEKKTTKGKDKKWIKKPLRILVPLQLKQNGKGLQLLNYKPM